MATKTLTKIACLRGIESDKLDMKSELMKCEVRLHVRPPITGKFTATKPSTPSSFKPTWKAKIFILAVCRSLSHYAKRVLRILSQVVSRSSIVRYKARPIVDGGLIGMPSSRQQNHTDRSTRRVSNQGAHTAISIPSKISNIPLHTPPTRQLYTIDM